MNTNIANMSQPNSINRYPKGTGVWAKVLNRVWWPGVVVDSRDPSIPEELLEFLAKVQNIVAVVKFEQDNKYQVVAKDDPIFLYNCDRKMEFVEKGYSLYKNQKKGLPVINNFDMNSFKKEIISLERLTGGDVHIFENLEKRLEEIKAIKQAFTSTNTKKSKKKEVGRKSLSEPKTPQPPKTAPKTTPKSTPKTAPKTTPKSPKQSKPLVFKSRTSLSRVRMTTDSSSPSYSCHFQVGCKFATNRYDNLKRHIANHKNNTDVVTTDRPSTSSTSNKRKKVKTKSSDIKKQKLQEELLRDWENDEDDEDELNTSDVPLSSNVLQSSNEEVVQATSEVQLSSNIVQSSNEEVVQTTSEVQLSSNIVQSPNEEVVQSTSEVIPTSNVVSSENDVTPTINKVEETITSSAARVFDFNENDNHTPVVELRLGNSNCNSTADDNVSETLESQLTSDFINNTIFKASPTKSILAVKTTEDSSDKPHEIHSNEIDDQTKSTELLLEKTVNTLDQINNFENSLSCISSGINESDANLLTEDNNVVIDVSELCDEHPKEPTSINKDIHSETNGIDIPLIEKNMAIETEDHIIIEENTNDKKIVSNDLEVNQSNGTTDDKNMAAENSVSVDSTSNNINSEDEIQKKLPCIDSMPNPEWSKEEIWESFTQNGVTEAKNFAIEEITTRYLPRFDDYIPKGCCEMPSVKLEFQELTLRSQNQETTTQNDKNEPEYFYFPINYGPHPTLEELNALPFIDDLRKSVMNGFPLSVNIE